MCVCVCIHSLIKMLYYMCEQSGVAPTWPQLEHAIKRNFGGLESVDCNPFEEFKKQIFIPGVQINSESVCGGRY